MIIQQLNNLTQPSGNASPSDVGAAPAKQPVAPVTNVNSTPESSAHHDAQVNDVVDHINQAIQSLSRNLNFSVDKDTGITVVKVLDTETNQLIRQIPGDEILSIAKAIDTLRGLIIRQKA